MGKMYVVCALLRNAFFSNLTLRFWKNISSNIKIVFIDLKFIQSQSYNRMRA